MLLDPSAIKAARSEFINYADVILDYLEPADSPGRKPLARQLAAELERIYADADTAPAWKMPILMTELAMLPLISDNVDASKTQFAERAEAVLAEAQNHADRLVIAPDAARILKRTGRELRGEAVLRETVAQAPEAYWLMSDLANYAKSRGDFEAQLQFSEKAFRLSTQSTNGLAYGSLWLKALIDLAPRDTQRIATASDEIIELALGEGASFLGWNDDSMTLLAMSLGQWMSAGDKPGAAVKAHVTASFGRLCGSLRNDAAQHATCEATMKLLTNPPQAAAPA